MKIIGAATGLGAQDPASGQGPNYLAQNAPEFKELWKEIIHTGQLEINNNITVEEKIDLLIPFFTQLTQSVKHTLLNKEFPLIIGGDHSIAIASWKALVDTRSNDIGLMWLDAHLDSHTFNTTPSKAIHGMPLACLLGYGDDKFLANKNLKPENVVVFGARSYEPGEKVLLDFLGVRIYEMIEIQDRGLDICFNEALSIVSKPQLDFGISIDLDMFEPTIIGGVCSKENNGIMPNQFLDVFKNSKALYMNNFKMFEIVEFAPSQDKNGKTFQIIKDFIKVFLIK